MLFNFIPSTVLMSDNSIPRWIAAFKFITDQRMIVFASSFPSNSFSGIISFQLKEPG
jgi:hypothetical protein